MAQTGEEAKDVWKSDIARTVLKGIPKKEFNLGLLLSTLQKLDYGIDIFTILGIQPLSEDVIAEQFSRLPRNA